jgi:calcium-dependent protein kinase
MGCCKLKQHPEILTKNLKFTEAVECSPVPHRTTMSNFVNILSENLEDEYRLIRVIGEGGYGQVKEVIEKSTGNKRAVKSIHLKILKKVDISNIFEEVKILKTLDHPGIIKIFQVYKEAHSVHIITELCTGGELFDHITKKKNISENTAARYLLDIVSTIKYLHESGFMHRDLKPDNILFEDKSSDSRLKIIDFGAATRITKNPCRSLVGTPYYIAPEVLKGEYDQRCDIWSIGVILFTMLSGSPPFLGESNSEIYSKILEDSPNFDSKNWSKVSKSAKNLIKQILVKNPAKRITLNDLYFDPWLRTRAGSLVADRILSKVSMRNLSKFRKINKFQACTFVYLSQCFTTANELQHIRLLFENFDVNGDGRLSVEELRTGIEKYSGGLKIDADEIMKNCDLDDNGFIDYSEFLAAVCTKSVEVTKIQLKTAFDAIDTDGSGKLSRAEIMKALVGMTDEKSVNELIRAMDLNGDGEIDLEEFTNAILMAQINKTF